MVFDFQDTYGNTVLHMVVIVEQLGMFGYALKHPVKKANHMVANNRNLTSLTLSCELGRDTIFQVFIINLCTLQSFHFKVKKIIYNTKFRFFFLLIYFFLLKSCF